MKFVPYMWLFFTTVYQKGYRKDWLDFVSSYLVGWRGRVDDAYMYKYVVKLVEPKE